MSLPAVRTIAYYLPQFAPAPENDRWWGPGFTEWSNVLGARPRWLGHRQPRLPGPLGAYDLRDPRVLQRQVDLAKAHNIQGFCFYHYWLSGHRLLGRFLDQFLARGTPDIGFCLSWGNHHWARKWDASASHGLLAAQHYSPADDAAHARFLLGVFADPRHLRVHGRPLFLVHRASEMPSPAAFVETLSTAVTQAGEERPYLCLVESTAAESGMAAAWGFDASVDFQPSIDGTLPRIIDYRLAPVPLPVDADQAFRNNYFVDYTKMRERALSRISEIRTPPYRHPCVIPDWDNTARRPVDPAAIFLGSTPERYRRWVEATVDALRKRPDDERLLFVNAWNEWGEGAYLEPDVEHGTAYLEAHLP